LLCLMSLVQLIRIQKFEQTNDTMSMLPKKMFHAIISLAMCLKSAFFVTHPFMDNAFDKIPQAVIIGWFELATFFIFLGFLALVLFWADIYDYFENGASKPFFKKRKVRTILAVISILLSVMVISFMACLVMWRDSPMNLSMLQIVSEIVIVALFLSAGFTYTVYGIRLVSLLRRVKIMSGGAYKVALVATSITLCFIIRALLTLYSVILAMQVSSPFTVRFDTSPAIVFACFFFTEILPSFLMLFFLRKLPKWKDNSIMYKPVQ